jgi:DNA mismatch repair ATPase MutS
MLEGGHVRRALQTLEQGVALADFRLSTWLYLPVQTFTLWDLHVWWGLERWRQRHGRHVRGWLEAIGRIEALSALASLAHDHPEWAFPTIHDTPDERALRIDAGGLGHALLPNATRVVNDVAIGPKGRFLLVTGSNMSGKSTLMRAVGVNIVLAHAGAPVCAREMELPLVALHTSMRVADSLERGLSLFMASLVRLERIVRAAREAGPARPVCYLLDEVLQGTNSAERRVAVRTIVDHLLASWAVGVVTTHDLDLARDPSFAAHAESVHLQETLAGTGDAVTMTFDYRLRPGPATGGNALQLLRLLGLE